MQVKIKYKAAKVKFFQGNLILRLSVGKSGLRNCLVIAAALFNAGSCRAEILKRQGITQAKAVEAGVLIVHIGIGVVHIIKAEAVARCIAKAYPKAA